MEVRKRERGEGERKAERKTLPSGEQGRAVMKSLENIFLRPQSSPNEDHHDFPPAPHTFPWDPLKLPVGSCHL